MTNTKLACIWRDGCNQFDVCQAAECCQAIRSNLEKAELPPSNERFSKVDKILNNMLAIRNVHGDQFVSIHTFGGYLDVENGRLLRDWLNMALPASAHEPPAVLDRYSIEMEGDICGAVKVEKLDPNGEWVLFEDVEPFLRAAQPPCAMPEGFPAISDTSLRDLRDTTKSVLLQSALIELQMRRAAQPPPAEPKLLSTVEMLREVENTLIDLGWHKDLGVLKRVTDCLDEVGRNTPTKGEG